MRHLTGFAPLAARYDGFIVDLWGVVHDGLTPYEGAIGCLERLRAAGKRVALLSNAPRRTVSVRQGLRRMGVADSLYDAILTSGETTRAALLARTDPWIAALGRHVLHLGSAEDRDVLEGVGLDPVDDPAEADFLLNTGANETEGDTDPQPYLPLLRACAARGLPMVCANPDLEIVRGGARIICAGLLARFYAQYGGVVRQFGKPYSEVYDAVCAMLGMPRARILAVGDALATDIAGAEAAGLESCWVLGGIHAELVGGDHALAEAEARAVGLSPVATVPALRW